MDFNDPNDVTVSLLRHVGTLAAGFLIRKGWVDTSATEAIIGIVGALGVGILAWWNKRQSVALKAATAQVALSLPSNSQPSTLNNALAANALPRVDLDELEKENP